MPVIESKYQPPFFMRHTDIMTIYTAKLRKVKGVIYHRERIELPDGDFIDLDWSKAPTPTDKCIIMLHGLEGSSQSQYMLGLAKQFNQKGYDACAVNFRSCSGEPNRLFTCYHSGQTDDLSFVIQYIIQKKQYQKIVLHGVSLGANVALKYAGENQNIPHQIKVVIAISAPCDLSGSSAQLLKKRNILYAQNFIKQLKQKVEQKQRQFPNKISQAQIEKIKTIIDFDNIYTAHAHGFQNAEDYYKKNSSTHVLHQIQMPTLILNAQNDSFISKKSSPYAIAKENPNVYLETPKYGGHVAFWQPGGTTYNEERALIFAEQFIDKH